MSQKRSDGPGIGSGPLGAKRLSMALALGGLSAMAAFAPSSYAADPVSCQRTVTADVVAFDKPLMYNRMGAGNVNGMMFALKRDVVDAAGVPLTVAGANPVAGQLDLRGDKRQRPLILRVRKGDCLTVNLTNWLSAVANPRNVPFTDQAGEVFRVPLDEQVADRHVGFHSAGMQLVNGIADDGSFVGNNGSSLAAANGGTASYTLFAQKEGVFAVKGDGASFGSDGNEGLTALGLFGQVIVEPTGAAIYRGQVFEEELRLASTPHAGTGLPILSYEATYPATNADGSPSVWVAEGKAGLPVLNMMQCSDSAHCAIVHSEINGVIAYGPNGQILGDGKFPASTYPLESQGKRNPSLPNRLEPFRDFASVFHDETVNGQAFPGFFVRDRVFNYVLAGVKDAFMINYGSGGIGSEIIANRLAVGPMHDCLSCAYEEFFLTSFTVADPGMTVDIPANFGLEALLPGQAPPPGTQGPKANYAIGAEDPANIHHSYTGDFVKFRNTHNGKEQHVFHLHNHQWLYNPNDDNANYLDAQGIGPGIGYTYEINFGGSGNRNKTAGDAIFHCHFYPHFAQGMWYHWRNHDVFEAGTLLNATGGAGSFHATRWALANTTPAAGARALPDGEIAHGTPIPAVVPLPGKAMAPVPGFASVKFNPLTVPNNPQFANPGAPVGSLADLGRDAAGNLPANAKNPGFPFWIGGIEDIVGQRPPTPPLDMLNKAQATALLARGGMWSQIDPDQADGWDGGLRRHALKGVAAGGTTAFNVVTPIDFSKVIASSDVVYFPEEGNDVEQLAMAFHSVRLHPSITSSGAAANFVTNGGGGPVVGAPYHNPCIDDEGNVLRGQVGNFFSGESLTGMSTRGRSIFNSDNPRIYKGTNLQFDAVLNKVGYHFPQQRIVALWQDVGPVTAKQKPPEPLVMRLNTFDCAIYHHSNLVPEAYEIDDYQVRTPTDIIGQHIHLPKWDLTTTDGSANGWNYEDGTLSPGAVRERIHAIRAFNLCADPDPRDGTDACPVAQDHPFFAAVAQDLDGAPVGNLPARENFQEAWKGARTTMQRWFADPVVNTEGVDRGLGIIFTHDHYGPSTHQQVGLYSTVLAEPAASRWVHNETGEQLGYDPATGAAARTATATNPITGESYIISDGGPTSWQAAILPQANLQGQNTVGAGALEAFREFYFEFTDFQHAYEAGVYVGANQKGLPLEGTGPALPMQVGNEGNPQFTQAGENAANAFRFAINPPARFQINPVFPDLVLEAVVCVKDALGRTLLSRPCPQAIDVQDPGVLVVNYRHEPIALRIFDPNKVGPDNKAGMQADGERGDLAFALQSRTDRAIPQMNVQPVLGTSINGTLFPAPINAGGVKAGDPFTAMVRTYTGDTVRVKMQAGGDEEEHNATIHGMKWLQGGSGHGKAPNSGWRNAQAAGISEQFTLVVPVTPSTQNVGSSDYFYSMDGGTDGWWSGMWGILRSYNTPRNDLFQLPTTMVPVRIANPNDFRRNRGACPDAAPVRPYDITAVLANSALGNALGVTINPGGAVGTQHVGGALNADGGTLVYNHREARVGGGVDPETGLALPQHQGPIHDPTAILYVQTDDLVPQGAANTAANRRNMAIPVKLAATAPVEPVVIRAGAGECVQVILRNRLPALATVTLPDLPPLQVVNPDGTVTLVPATGLNSTAPDLATYTTILGVNKRDRFLLEGSTTFQTNLYRASSWVGVTPGLAAIDVNRDSGIVIGDNAAGQALVVPGANKTYFWYAGDLAFTRTANRQFQLNPTPVEFGGANILSADRVKQGAKSLVGALAVEPRGATWAATPDFQVFDHQDGQGTRATRTQAKVNNDAFRSFSVVLTKGQTQYYKDGSPVEHMNGEGAGIPEDPQEASGMALNYGIEPMWFRFGILPQSAFGHAGVANSYGGIANASEAYSNGLAVPFVGGPHGDPVTPVLQAKAGQPARIHITNPHGTTRGSTFALHGHVWQRDPYVCPGESHNGLGALLDGACNVDKPGQPATTVGSRALGNNPIGFAQGGQESWNAPSHFEIVLPSAGGAFNVQGDYLYRDSASFGNASGVWGILRVGAQ